MSVEFVSEKDTLPTRPFTLPKKPRKIGMVQSLLLAFVAAFILSVWELHLPWKTFLTGTKQVFVLIAQMFPMSFADWKTILGDAGLSLEIAFAATALSIVLGFLLAFLVARNVAPSMALSRAIVGVASFLRAVPILVWALVFIVAVGPGPFAGLLSILTHALGQLIKVYSQAIEEVDEGVTEAMRATGASWLQTIGQGIMPSAQGAFISWAALRLEFDIGDAMTLGIVGAGGIGWDVDQEMNQFDLHSVFFSAAVIFFIVLFAEAFANFVKNSRRKSRA